MGIWWLASALICCVALGVTGGPGRAAGPSFDCNKASTPNERMICADGQLRELDLELTRSYRGLLDMVSSSEGAAIRDVQRAWLQDRQNCGSDYQCTIGAYATRTRQLQSQIANAGGPADPGAPDWADGPSFDCRRATTHNERLVCASAELSALDLQMAQAYYTLLERAPAWQGSEISGVQTRWLQDRQGCGRDHDCTASAYYSRIDALQEELSRF
jgi:uncharacterized protein